MLQITDKPLYKTNIKSKMDGFSLCCHPSGKASVTHSDTSARKNSHLTSFFPKNSGDDKKPPINLLEILKSSHEKNEGKVFKPIGNQIVVPFRVPLSAKRFSGHSTILSKVNVSCKQNIECKTKRIIVQNENCIVPGKSKSIKMDKTQLQLNECTILNKTVKSEPVHAQDGFPLCAQQMNTSYNTTNNAFEFDVKTFSQHHDLEKDIHPPSAMDGDLTSLSWLSKKDSSLLQTIRKCNPDDPSLTSNDDTDDDAKDCKNVNSIFTALTRIYNESVNNFRCPGNSKNQAEGKTMYSFNCLIFMAIEDSETKKLKVKDIYRWVGRHFPDFCSSSPSWKNSIRHNLSLNRCFMKSSHQHDSIKNLFWCINPVYRENLVRTLKRCYFHHTRHADIKEPAVLKHLINRSSSDSSPPWSAVLEKPSELKFHADPDITDAALNLMGLSEKGFDGKSSKVESINNTLDEIFRDAYFQNGYAQTLPADAETFAEGLVVIREELEEHNYCVTNSSRKKKKRRKRKEDIRCESPHSDKSAPDAAYEFESGAFLDHELDMDVVEDIMEEIMIGSDGEEEEESLFDSGFGSMRDFNVSEQHVESKAKSRQFESKKDRKQPSATGRRCSKKDEEKLCGNKSRSERYRNRNKHPVAVLKRKKKKVQKRRKNSASDSGKDSPKSVRRTKRRAATNAPSSRLSLKSKIGQSKGAKQATEKTRQLPERNRRLPAYKWMEYNDEDEEIKSAAGSLLRLAGLIKSTS